MTRSLLSNPSLPAKILSFRALALSGLAFGLGIGAMLMAAPSARADASTSIEVNFSGVVHPPCYGNNADGSAEQGCQLSRSEESVTAQPAWEQQTHNSLAIPAETAKQWRDELEENLKEGQVQRRVNTEHPYRLVTLTPS